MSIIFGVVLIVCLWLLVNNQKTYSDREKIRLFVFNGNSWEDKLEIYEAVSYSKHLWFRFTFRNPNQLYKF